MKIHLLVTLLLSTLFGLVRIAAQGSDALLTSVGTTVQTDGQFHAYLLWQPGDSSATLGKRFAIYQKTGLPDSPDAFTRVGMQTLQSSPNTIRALLTAGSTIDRAAALAPTRIDALYQQILLNPGAAPATPPDPSLDAAGKLSYLIQSAVTDSRTLSRLFFLGRAHPGVMMALGHAFATPVKPGVHTFEIREIDLSDHDLRVLGRITLDTANPVELVSPSAPVRVFHPVQPNSQHTVNPKDHLNARLRWGVNDTLRSQMPHSFGFDLFRVSKKTAEKLGWHATPPTPDEMISALAGFLPSDPNPAISLANELPILSEELLTPAEAADPANTDSIAFADDGIWYLDSTQSKKVRRPYSDGEAFYYFVAARSITGAPGKLSSGSLVVMCDRMPPMPPTIQSVTSQFVRPANPADWATQGGSQYLQIKFRQLPAAPLAESATGYYLYRWNSAQEYLNHLGNPLVGRINATPITPLAGTYRTFNDNGAGAPTLLTHADRTVFYTVRAIGRSACGDEVLSGHSSPVGGVLRDFKAPSGPSGDFIICRHVPKADYVKREVQDPVKNGLPEGYIGVGIDLHRTSDQITSAHVEVATRGATGDWNVIHSKSHRFQESATIRVNLPVPEPSDESRALRIRVKAASSNGAVSTPAEVQPRDQKAQAYAVHLFTLSTELRCNPVSTEPGDRPTHEGFDPLGIVTPIQGSLNLPPAANAHEWRVYRRVNGGDASLIAKGEGSSLPPSIVWTDPALPSANGTTICYFGQVLDQNANPSPLVPLGCTTISNPDLPTPMLAEPRMQNLDSADPTRANLRLEWFCNPTGVDRFEILAAREGGGDPGITGLNDKISSTPLSGISTDTADLEFHRYQSPRVGSGFSQGPSFGISLQIPTDANIFFAIRACGPGGPDERTCGSVSNVVHARWQSPPTGPQPVIPWPARPLPGAFDMRQNIAAYIPGEGPLWAAATPNDFNVASVVLIGLANVPVVSSSQNDRGTTLQTRQDPAGFLFKIRENRDDATTLGNLMPFMLFRYQEPSALFPSAKPNLVQCTPLIDRISWNGDAEKGTCTIRDPFIAVLPLMAQLPLPVSGDWTTSVSPVTASPTTFAPLPPYLQGATAMMLLNDPLPVTTGAKYRHILTQFDASGEIKRVIPLDPVQH